MTVDNVARAHGGLLPATGRVSPGVGYAWAYAVHPLDGEEALSEVGVFYPMRARLHEGVLRTLCLDVKCGYGGARSPPKAAVELAQKL